MCSERFQLILLEMRDLVVCNLCHPFGALTLFVLALL